MRRRSLDLLRFLAVILVLFRHYDASNVSMANEHGYMFVQHLQRIGWIGVDLFFVLSGFLVSNLIFEEIDKTGNFSIARFVIRRGFKIYPSFYFFIFVTGVLLYLKGELTVSALLAEIVYLQNYFNGMWNHTWSLAVEEHFYLFLALTFSCFLRFKSKVVGNQDFQFILISLILLSICLKILYSYRSMIDIESAYFTHLRIDSLLVGVFLTWLYRYRPIIFAWWAKYVSIFVFLIMSPMALAVAEKGAYDVIQLKYGFVLLYVYFGNLLMMLVQFENGLRYRIFDLPVKIGVYSYSIYLWHIPVKFLFTGFIARHVSLGYWTNLFGYLIVCIGLGYVLYRLVEYPMLIIRNKFYPAIS